MPESTRLEEEEKEETMQNRKKYRSEDLCLQSIWRLFTAN